jgi:outer membrane cobalamin receptor
MNTLLDIWHRHTFKITAVLVTPLLLAFFVSKVQAEEIEEVVVVAQQVEVITTNPLQNESLIEEIIPEFTWNAGGLGGFVGYNERGAQTVHTSVYRNGVPANNPGSGWYDFGHDVVSGETVTVISGANGVMYGSGAVAGTVLIQDTIDSGVTARFGPATYRYYSVAPTDWFQVTDVNVNQPSVRSDNEEADPYSNTTAKAIIDVGDFVLKAVNTDYTYSYDNCYTASFSQTNDCTQEGNKQTLSVSNEYFTIGRTTEQAEYFTEDTLSYLNESSRDYFRVGDTVDLSNLLQVTYGADGNKEKYNEHKDDNYGVFLSINATFALDYNFGIRAGNDDQNALRLGIAKDQFFFNVGTSYRKANLYEMYGDAYVDANDNLMPEEGTGYELGFGAVSIFLYDFEESIEYQSGSMVTTIIEEAVYNTEGVLILDAVTEDVYTNASYYNSGSYVTKGVRFDNQWGPFGLLLKYNDSDQPRIAEYIIVLDYMQTFKGVELGATYKGLFDRTPGAYDLLPAGQEFLDDLKVLDLYAIKKFSNGVSLSGRIDNITDEEAEPVPGYGNDGREIYITINYNW